MPQIWALMPFGLKINLIWFNYSPKEPLFGAVAKNVHLAQMGDKSRDCRLLWHQAPFGMRNASGEGVRRLKTLEGKTQWQS